MSIQQRKIDHLNLIASGSSTDRKGNYFDEIHLTHRALPELNFNDIDTHTDFLNHILSMPFLIASMTGGEGKKIQAINQHLAEAAQTMKIPMAVGSQRIQLSRNKAKQSFNLRQYAPDIPLIANIGAVQLNYGVGVDEILQIIETLDANALYLHLNPLQETIQPEGNTNFRGLADKIHRLSEQLPIPIILKEVGAGLSTADIQLGLDAGIRWFDLAGRGGTSWSRIEAERNTQDNDGILFQDWGIPTPLALREAQVFKNEANFIASGGLRNGLDLAKSVILGAHLGSMASPLLTTAMESTQATLQLLQQIQRQLATSMFLLGAKKIKDLRHRTDFILS
ncbi:MAG: type 2 isopentenyl-diphosphate Delta-isomerase [Thiotrichaceae bacterium]